MSQWIDTISKTLTNEKPSRRHALKAMGGFRFFLVVLVSLLALAPQSGHPNPAVAATQMSYAFTVNTTNDTHDAHPGDGKCADKMGRCSLRAAVEEADALPSGSRIAITVPKGTYTLTLGTLKLTGTHSITITGASSKTTLIKGNHTFGIMRIAANVSAHLSQLTISDGKATYGGGIFNQGTLTLSNSTLSNNSAPNGLGGGILNESSVSVSNSTLSNNSAPNGYGGGIDNESYGTLTVSNSTLSGNSAPNGYGGGIDEYNSIVSVSNSTLSGNSASHGGSIYQANGGHGFARLRATIVANSPKGGNCNGPVVDKGYNLDSGTTCGFVYHALNKTDPMLGPLQNNGGPTWTMALLPGSKAIDWGAESRCPTTDQRGYMRPDDHESACDIGAYESAYETRLGQDPLRADPLP